MSDTFTAPSASPPNSGLKTAQRSRQAPKSDEQLLADAVARTGRLRAKVIANRDRQRMELVEDLYEKHGVGPVEADMSESKRLAALRLKLGL